MFELSKHGTVDVIAGEGPLCSDTLDELNDLVETLLSLGPPRIVFNLTDVPFIDGAGLEWLLDVRDRCTESGGIIHLASPNPLCHEILYITGVGAQLESFDEVLLAIGSFAR